MTALEILSRTFRPIQLQSSRFQQSGVYLLVAGDAIVYIGASRNVSGRVGSWSGRKSRRDGEMFDWDRTLWMPLPWSVTALYEHALIRELSPVGNNRCNSPTQHEDEILFGLGLRDVLDESAVQWEAVL